VKARTPRAPRAPCPRSVRAPRPALSARELQRLSHGAQAALLAAFAHQDTAGRRAILDAAEAVARGSDRPGLALAAGRFLQAAR